MKEYGERLTPISSCRGLPRETPEFCAEDDRGAIMALSLQMCGGGRWGTGMVVMVIQMLGGNERDYVMIFRAYERM